MKLGGAVKSLVVPVPAMVFRAQGLQLATVVDGKAKLVPITVGQDDGTVVQVVTGLTPDAEVIQNPPDSIVDGEAVHIVQPRATGPSGPSGGNRNGAQQQTGSTTDGGGKQ